MAEPLVALRHIRVQHGARTVLDVPHLEIACGEAVAIIGPNGAGKSTLLRVIGLLQPPANGNIRFAGELATRKNSFDLRRRMASALQAPLLLDGSVYANAALGLKLRGMAGQEIAARLQPWLSRLGIAHLSDRPVRTLSGGEVRRTCLARAFALEPELLLLDEPFSALDTPSREALLLDLQQILGNTAAAMVLVTHDISEAAALAQRIGVINGGRLLQLGAPEDILCRPANEDVALSAGLHNRIVAIVTDVEQGAAIAQFPGGTAYIDGHFSAGEQIAIRCRPQDVELSCNRDGERSAAVHMPATILRASRSMSQYRVVLEGECGPIMALVGKSRFEALHVSAGDAVTVSFPPTIVRLDRSFPNDRGRESSW